MSPQMNQSMSPTEINRDHATELTRWVAKGLVLVVLVVALIGGWGAMANIASAVIATGRVVVESHPKVVQHREGGIVGEIFVREGDLVTSGDLLVRLDGTATRANLAIVTKQLTELDARSARLRAIAEGMVSVHFSAALEARRIDPEVGAVLAGEEGLFLAHKTMVADEFHQLEERIAAYGTELRNYKERGNAARRELALLREEQVGLDTLYKKDVISLNRINQGKRGIARLEGEIATTSAYISDVQGRLSESQLSILRLEKAARAKALEEWRDLQAQRIQLDERRIAADDKLRRLEIKAPQAGMIHGLTLHTIGGVVAQGETLMNIVPIDDALVVEGRVRPLDIDEIHLGQLARVRFPALNMRTTPELSGLVIRVGADLTVEQYTDQAFYDIRIVLDAEQLAAMEGLGLVPGMPAEVFVQTGERSALSYVLQPLTDQIYRAFRE
jgi:HlyD family secretion protein